MHSVYEEIGAELGIEPALVYAITKTESNGVFSYGDGKIPLLLERHWVYKYVKKELGRAIALELSFKYPHIINKRPGGYSKDEYKRVTDATKYLALEFTKHTKIESARKIANEIVYKSASWGAFQIMGFNYALCGYESAVKMVEAYHQEPKKEQIRGFISFITQYKRGKVLRALKAKNWQRVAYYYNGRAYKRNRYDKKLESAYRSFVA